MIGTTVQYLRNSTGCPCQGVVIRELNAEEFGLTDHDLYELEGGIFVKYPRDGRDCGIETHIVQWNAGNEPVETMPEISTAYGRLGHLSITVSSEVDGEKLGDAKVEMQGGVLCWIRAENREQFLNEMNTELNKIVDKYRI